jgi:hypothetical protein
MGRHVFNVRLRYQRLATEGGRVECDFVRFHDRWLLGTTEYVTFDSWTCLSFLLAFVQVDHAQHLVQQLHVVFC